MFIVNIMTYFKYRLSVVKFAMELMKHIDFHETYKLNDN